MCVALRNTARLGRCGVPDTRRRTRRWRCCRCSRLVFTTIGYVPSPAIPDYVLLLTTLTALAGLAGFAAHVFALVADPFALVWLGLADRPDVRCYLADELLVDPLDANARRALDVERDPRRRQHLNRVREAERQRERVSLLGDAVADTLDLQHPHEAIRNAGHHVGEQGSTKAVQGTMLRFVVGTAHQEGAVLLLDPHRRMELALQLPFRAADDDQIAILLDLDAAND